MLNKQSLLLIEPFTALPQTSGGRTRILYTIKELNKYFNLNIWSFISNKQEENLTTSWLNNLNIPFRYFSVNLKKNFSFLKVGQPYWFSDWYNNELKMALKNDADNFSMIQVEFSQLLYLVNYLPKSSKKVFVAHDIACVSFWRRLQNENNLLKKILHFWRMIEIYLYERKYLSKFDEIVAVSNHDAAILRSHFGIKNVKVIPNAINEVCLLAPRKKDGYINLGYIGSFDHAPNLEAVKFLLNKILPELEIKNIKHRLYLGGANSEKFVSYLIEKSPIKNKNTVEVIGYVTDLKDFYQKIDLLVAPIFAGSGTRIKILESLSFGKPVITTEIGAEGIEIVSSFFKILSKKTEKISKIWLNNIVALSKINNRQTNNKEKLKTKLSKTFWKNIFKIYYLKTN